MSKRKIFTKLANIEPKELDWLWEPIIPFGMVTIMEGDPGVGKSYLAAHLASLVTTGGRLPNGQKLKKGRMLYLSAEDDPSYTIRPRFDAMKGDPERIRIQSDFLCLDARGEAKATRTHDH